MADLRCADDWDNWGITCQCGHFDTFDKFETHDEGHRYHCPACDVQWLVKFNPDCNKEIWVHYPQKE